MILNVDWKLVINTLLHKYWPWRNVLRITDSIQSKHIFKLALTRNALACVCVCVCVCVCACVCVCVCTLKTIMTLILCAVCIAHKHTLRLL